MSAPAPVVPAPHPALARWRQRLERGAARGQGRGTRVIIDRTAFRHNLASVRGRTGASRIMAVVKADGYGHGLERTVEALADADGFAVATFSEALRVRAMSATHPVLLLEGILDAVEIEAAAELQLWIAVHSSWQLALLEAARPTRALRVWLKVDTGMHRLGFGPDEAPAALERLRACPHVDPRIVLMSHLANADDLEDPKTLRQCDRFASLQERFGLPTASLANSAGALAWEGCGLSWARVGLALYGASPVAGTPASELGLRPCMTLESTLIAINRCRIGDPIGYGGTWRCPEDLPIGIVAIGYGDGYPRHAGNGTPVLVAGRRCPLVGRVSMDTLAVDLRPAGQVAIGAPVQLWGTEISVETIAQAAEMIPYELLCGITARVPVIYRC